ncbi:DISARM system phospholipase D-like protein DrmC [Tunturiibacter psychrotolerans]|uniref:DISARM system phospholipase D-like protein DrmC n=1 Tax=Tunturiibacter psychrotolerans TaxID=3069686 RepID=UPI003D20F6D0
MIPSSLKESIVDLIRRAHHPWLQTVCLTMSKTDSSIGARSLIATLPATNNGDAAHCLASVIRLAENHMSWNSLSVLIEVSVSVLAQQQQEQFVELLWTGPSPSSEIPARRIDQVLYDLIDFAKREILLVTFAAHKITRLSDGLAKAIGRGVRVRLILEFEEASQGQLSMDALNAFPKIIRQGAQVYYWPLDKRERNAHGKPGKLHAKVAVIDDQAVLSSANLTDDAFNRNFELGSLFTGDQILHRLTGHFDGLCADGTLKLWEYPKLHRM